MKTSARLVVMLIALIAVALVACTAREPAVTIVDTAPSKLEQRLDRNQVEQIYQHSCYGCHEKGVSGAPRTGDVLAWAPRLEQGMDILVEHAITGYRAMPPRGLCFDCSAEEYSALIHFMSGKARPQNSGG